MVAACVRLSRLVYSRPRGTRKVLHATTDQGNNILKTVGYELGDRASDQPRESEDKSTLRSNSCPSTRARKRDGKSSNFDTAITRGKDCRSIGRREGERVDEGEPGPWSS